MAIILESISGLVTTDSAEELFDCIHHEHFPLPTLTIGRVSIAHSLETLANRGTYQIDSIISLGRTGVSARCKGTLHLFADTHELTGVDAEMTVWEQRSRSVESYFVVKGKPTLNVGPLV